MTALLSAFVAGCGTAPPVVAPPPQATVQPPSTAPATGTTGTRPAAAVYQWTDRLAAAAQRLNGSLQGGEADVSQTTDQRLWISLPADQAFAPGRSALKPPATGWMDQVAAALRDLPRAEVQVVSDADAGNSTSARTLALDRAAAARDWLVIRGIPPQRIGVAARTAATPTARDARRLDILIGERTRSQP